MFDRALGLAIQAVVLVILVVLLIYIVRELV